MTWNRHGIRGQFRPNCRLFVTENDMEIPRESMSHFLQGTGLFSPISLCNQGKDQRNQLKIDIKFHSMTIPCHLSKFYLFYMLKHDMDFGQVQVMEFPRYLLRK